MLKNKFTSAILVIIILTSISIVTVESRRCFRGRRSFRGRPIVKFIAWFNYRDGSIRWRADKANGSFLVDLDGDHNTLFFSDVLRHHPDWGAMCDVGISVIENISLPWGGWYIRQGYGWVGSIGTEHVDCEGHINKTSIGQYSESFYVTVRKKEPPTDWVVILYMSDGENIMPVTKTFWYSIDAGETWKSFIPRKKNYITR